MYWYIFAFISPLLWAVSNHTDKFILGRYFKNTSIIVLTIFSGLVESVLFLSILIFYNGRLWGISPLNAAIIIFNGALLIIAFIPYYFALKEEDASSVVPLYQAIPVFSFILGLLILHETGSIRQIVAGLIIISASIFLSIDLGKSKFQLKKRVLFLMLLSSFLLSIYYFIFKMIALQESYWATVFFECIGGIVVSIFILVFLNSYRKQFLYVFKENSASIIFISMFNEGINIIAGLSTNYASLFVPIYFVNLANGVQPMFVFLIGVILTIFFPFINKEIVTQKHLIQRIISIFVLLFGTYLLIV